MLSVRYSVVQTLTRADGGILARIKQILSETKTGRKEDEALCEDAAMCTSWGYGSEHFYVYSDLPLGQW
eukprot:6761525-Karenia_brevis.AAC.1